MKLVAREFDPMTGFTEDFYHDEVDKKVIIHRSQDVEDTLKHIREANNTVSNKAAYGPRSMHHVARIPLSVLEKWLREEGFNWYAERRARINANPQFKVRPGKL
jgi:hypothetical protein